MVLSSPAQAIFERGRASSGSSESSEKVIFRGRNRPPAHEAEMTHVPLKSAQRRTALIPTASSNGIERHGIGLRESQGVFSSDQIESLGSGRGQFSALEAAGSNEESDATDDKDIAADNDLMVGERASGFFDYMDRERPSVYLGTKKGSIPPFLEAADASMRNEILRQWTNDGERKKHRKAERQLRRFEGQLAHRTQGEAVGDSAELDYNMLKDSFLNFMASDSRR